MTTLETLKAEYKAAFNALKDAREVLTALALAENPLKVGDIVIFPESPRDGERVVSRIIPKIGIHFRTGEVEIDFRGYVRRKTTKGWHSSATEVYSFSDYTGTPKYEIVGFDDAIARLEAE